MDYGFKAMKRTKGLNDQTGPRRLSPPDFDVRHISPDIKNEDSEKCVHFFGINRYLRCADCKATSRSFSFASCFWCHEMLTYRNSRGRRGDE